jgi:hypothetical protein
MTDSERQFISDEFVIEVRGCRKVEQKKEALTIRYLVYDIADI